MGHPGANPEVAGTVARPRGDAEPSAAAQPIATAPRDGTMVWLLVDYSGDGDHALADATKAWTIGFNGFDHTGDDEWRFAGWCWSHDHFTQGRGKPIAWRPIGFELEADDA